jgi:hypothetical protein
MNPLTPVDCASIKLFIQQIFDDLFYFETQMFEGRLVLMILGKNSPIPDDFCDHIIIELKEYHYVGQVIDSVEFGKSVVVKGVGE